MYKAYAYIKFQMTSPLAIGSGAAEETDKDIIRNSKGEPYIPATALAGVYGTLFSQEERDQYFGFVEINNISGNQEPSKSAESMVITYDARLCDPEKVKIGIRNGVGLDQYRTAIKGAKYDFEVLEPEAVFWTCLEYTSQSNDFSCLYRILSGWYDGKIVLGGKSMRGMGQTKVLEMKFASFDLAIPERLDKWLAFDVYSAENPMWEKWDKDKCYVSSRENRITVNLVLKQEGPISVRVYTTECSEDGKAMPDYGQLTYCVSDDKGKRIVVIPGTSWAGTFRHAMIALLGGEWDKTGDELEELFGNTSKCSGISFSETYFHNGKSKVVSRNAIDRFSGGASDKALFTEEIFYGGTNGSLSITFPRDIKQKYYNALMATIADLHEGFLTVGGESSIGHGLFSVQSVRINDEKLDNIQSGSEIYQFGKRVKGGEES